jgi:hypothetical protein
VFVKSEKYIITSFVFLYLTTLIANIYIVHLLRTKGTSLMATKIGSATTRAQNTQEHYFRVTDQVPGTVWYWSAVSSILVSAFLFLTGKRDWSIFVGQWPPTFLLFALYHKLVGTTR